MPDTDTAAGGVLVVNTGSSSVKYRLVDPATGRTALHGVIGHVGGERAVVRALAGAAALAEARPAAVGHRIVHGGTRFVGPTRIDDRVLRELRALAPLAPLHIPANIAGVEQARRMFPGVEHVAVFDTAFHHDLPAAAHTYAVPRLWRDRYGVRRYGFHGISHRYVSRRAAALLGREPGEVNVIVLHLGNGASACAVRGGRSVDTSMGLTPLEGLVMGTRSGDVDPALPGYLARAAGMDAEQVEAALNRESGLLALAGSNDVREVRAAAARGDGEARLAMDVYCHRLRKYVGAYFAVLGGIDALVFTGGVGENSPDVREAAVAGLDRLGLAVDPDRNEALSQAERSVSPEGAAVPVLVVPTDEEAEIAAQSARLLGLG